jgi:signal peptidase I
MSEGETKRRGSWATPTIVTLGLAAALLVMPFGIGVRVYRAPSGSMQPAIYPGDHLVVAKWSYGYSRYSSAPFSLVFPSGRLFGRAPERGDLAVFRPTPEPDRDFIKRVIGLPGDRIQMIDGVLHINGEAVAREDLGEGSFVDSDGGRVAVHVYREALPGGAAHLIFDRGPGELDNTRVYVVPPEHYFVMGDDRDNSADSRVQGVVGFVPFDNFVGRVAWVWETSSATRYREPTP